MYPYHLFDAILNGTRNQAASQVKKWEGRQGRTVNLDFLVFAMKQHLTVDAIQGLLKDALDTGYTTEASLRGFLNEGATKLVDAIMDTYIEEVFWSES